MCESLGGQEYRSVSIEDPPPILPPFLLDKFEEFYPQDEMLLTSNIHRINILQLPSFEEASVPIWEGSYNAAILYGPTPISKLSPEEDAVHYGKSDLQCLCCRPKQKPPFSIYEPCSFCNCGVVGYFHSLNSEWYKLCSFLQPKFFLTSWSDWLSMCLQIMQEKPAKFSWTQWPHPKGRANQNHFWVCSLQVFAVFIIVLAVFDMSSVCQETSPLSNGMGEHFLSPACS